MKCYMNYCPWAIVLAFLLSLFLLLATSSSPTTAISDDKVITPTPRPLFTPTPVPTPFEPSLTASSSHLVGDNDWTSGGPAGVNISVLAVHPTNPSVLFAGGDGGVYKTTDGGSTWVAVKTGSSILSLAIDPVTPNIIYAGAWECIYKSIDGGSNWITIDTGLPYGPSVRALAIDPRSPNVVYAGTLVYGVFKSSNSGVSWALANTGLASEIDVHALSIDPSNSSVIYAGTNAGVFKTTNAAQSWTSVSAGLQTSTTYYSVVVDPDNPNTVYVASLYNAYYAGIYRSTNGGTNWELANSGVVGAGARALAIASGVIYVATGGGGVFRSVDGGRRWQGIYPDMPLSSNAISIAVTAGTPQTIYVGVHSDQPSNRGVWQCTLTSPPPLTLPQEFPLKAVLIVGPLDAPTNRDTQAAIEAMEIKAALLESYGVAVVRLYHPNATWENIRANLSGASIVLYHGHGFGYNPEDSNYLTTGGANNGFCITDPNNLSGATLATQNMLIAYSQLAQNAIVMNFACYSAGSSASDTTVVSEEVARRRVNDYAYTFLTIGARAYFAGGDWSYYLNYALSSIDHTTGSAYQTAPGYNPATLRTYSHAQYPAYALWLDPSVNSSGQVTGWWSTFAGDLTLTGQQVWGDFPRLAVSPTRMAFRMASIDPNTDASTIHIANNGSGLLHWQAVKADTSWLSISPSSGTAPGDLIVSINKSGLSAGTYTGTVIISGEGAVYQSPQLVTVTLDVYVPTAAIIKPVTGTTVSDVVTVTVDGVGASVELYLDNALHGRARNLPASWSWSTRHVANGSHSLQAIVYSAVGSATASPLVTITVSNTPATTPWLLSGLGDQTIVDLAVAPSDRQVLYAATDRGGVYRTLDGGMFWAAVNNGLLANTNLSSLAISPNNSQVIYVGSNRGIYKSTNGGDSWSLAGLSGSVQDLAIARSDDQLLYAVGSGAYRSTNGGASWSSVLTNMELWSVAIDPLNDLKVFAGGDMWNQPGVIYKTVDGGTSWISRTVDSLSGGVRTIVIDPCATETIYASKLWGPGGVYKSITGGLSWVRTGLEFAVNTMSLVMAPSDRQILYAGNMWGGIYRTSDGGTTWASVSAGLPSGVAVPALAVDLSDPAIIYAGLNNGGVWKYVQPSPTPTPTNTPTATPTSTPTRTPTATSTATLIYRLYLPIILR